MSTTTKATHTPGPWLHGKRYGNHRTEILNSTGGRAIASVWTHERTGDNYLPTDEGAANARLIAAAPELLEALLHMLGAAETDCMDDKSNVWRSYMIDARAAIAKATT